MTVMPPFEIAVNPDGDRVVVVPKGEIDLSTVPVLRRRLDEAARSGVKQLVLDLRGVSFLDSSGLKLILDQLDRDVDFALIAGPESVHRVFEITGLHARIPFVMG